MRGAEEQTQDLEGGPHSLRDAQLPRQARGEAGALAGTLGPWDPEREVGRCTKA